MFELESLVRGTDACRQGGASFGAYLLAALHTLKKEGASAEWRAAAARMLSLLPGHP
jgi:hypothetical protein